MARTKINSADYTDFSSKDYADTAAAQDSTLYPSSYDWDNATSTTQTSYQNTNWNNQHGAYLAVSEFAGMIDRKAQYVVGKGYKIGKLLKGKQKKIIDGIKGNGLDTFNTLFYNAVRVYTLGGDFYAEIIRNKRGELKNLKPLNPGTVKVMANSRGIITHYLVYPQGNQPIAQPIRFKQEEIFHLAYNRMADQIHGQGVTDKLAPIIKMRREAMNDIRVVFHRYVKPLWIFAVDTDDTSEITTFKNKIDSTIEKAENLVIPKGTVDKFTSLSIPQYSTLDPLPWLNLLQREFLKAEGMPQLIMGADNTSNESSSKILYLSWQQVVEFNQMFLSEQIKAQLGLNIKFEFPANISPELIKDEKKDSSLNKQNEAIDK
jgi:hypothetical protein